MPGSLPQKFDFIVWDVAQTSRVNRSSQVTLMIILGDPSLMWASLFLVLGLIVWATTRETEKASPVYYFSPQVPGQCDHRAAHQEAHPRL